MHGVWPLLLFSRYWALYYQFPICCAGHATVSRRQWYPVQYPSTKLTNSLLSPWPLSCHFEQQQPRLQAMASNIVHKWEILAAVIIIFLTAFCFALHQLKWSEVMCLMVEYEFDSGVRNPLYCSRGVDGILDFFGTVHSIQNKNWKDETRLEKISRRMILWIDSSADVCHASLQQEVRLQHLRAINLRFITQVATSCELPLLTNHSTHTHLAIKTYLVTWFRVCQPHTWTQPAISCRFPLSLNLSTRLSSTRNKSIDQLQAYHHKPIT